MSPLEILQLVGYSTGAALHLWLGALLVRQRRKLDRQERVLLVLVISVGAWHASNLLVSLHALLGLDVARWAIVLRLADTIAVVSITFVYSLLLHAHLLLWASARGRPLRPSERARVFLSYIPALFLAGAVPRLWAGPYAPMFDKMASPVFAFAPRSTYVLCFALWAAYVLGLIAVTDFLIARISSRPREKRLMRTLGASFIVIGILILAAHAFGVGRNTTLGPYLTTLANLGSLLPSALLAYYVYRYRYLELIIKESLVIASFAAVVLVVYLYGIRTLGAWLAARYHLRAGAVESLLILALALLAAPLRRWLDRRFHKLFARETALYRDVLARIGANTARHTRLPELLRFIEERTVAELGLRQVAFITWQNEGEAAPVGNHTARRNGHDESNHKEANGWEKRVLERVRTAGWAPIEAEEILREHGYTSAYPLHRENRGIGLMLVDAPAEALKDDTRAVLEVLANQVAIAVEDCWLMEENVRLERRLAQGERLAALGQMAATVAHEVKNPLSAIKSIAQVMREDERLALRYTRDLDLIVGETDRLNRSVTQLLSFARTAPPSIAPCRAGELMRTVVELFRAEAEHRSVAIECRAATALAEHELDGKSASAMRDALANLLLNALQATPPQGRVCIEVSRDENFLLVTVTDEGPGIPVELAERIWEPFFTTKQRGTGLGLSIVHKRMEEVGGSARFVPQPDRPGARFELRLPLARFT